MRFSLPSVLVVSLGAALFAQAPPKIGLAVFHGRPVTYEVHGRYAVIEGDIIIGTVEDLQRSISDSEPRSVVSNSVLLGPAKWPNGVIPYEIDPNLTNPDRVSAAVQHWNTRTPLRLVQHSGEANYLVFTPGSFDAACESFVGMEGGKQEIPITDACTAGNLIHEIGHAFGLEHEQSRSDRNAYITVLYQNVDKRFRYNFDESPPSFTNFGYYDYGSIMHYPPAGFSRNNLDTLETVPVGIPIGQRTALSAGDIDGVSRLYGIVPTTTTITTIPEGLSIVIDGQTATAPQSYSWTPGSVHTLTVSPQQGSDPRYTFARWSDGGAVSHSITAAPDTTVYCAEFVLEYSAVVGVLSGSGTASLIPSSPDGYYPDRMRALVSATPQSGAQFVRWQGNTNFQANGYGVASSQAELDISLPNLQYLAQFTTQPVTTIDSEPRGRAVVVDGVAYLTPAGFLWTNGSAHSLMIPSPQTSGNNTARYNFTSWKDAPDANRTVMAGSQSTTYTAVFTSQYLLTTAAAGTGQVTVSPPSSDGFYDAGTVVQVTAQPGSGATFRYWLGDPVGGSQTESLVMSEDRFAAAIFGAPLAFRVLNSASNTGNPVFDNTGSLIAPQELVTLYGANIGPATASSGAVANGIVTSSVAGTRVLFDSQPAPILYASANQINVVAPSNVGSKSTTVVQVERTGNIIASSSIGANDTAPALFTADGSGTGPLAALNQDGSVNSPVVPATSGSVIVLYGTGGGLLTSSITDGQIAGSDLLPPKAPVYVRVGKLPAKVLYAGSAPGIVDGVLQVNVQLPAELIGGSAVPIQLIVGAYASPPGTTISVQ